MSTGVVLPYWPDRPPLEAMEVAAAADRLGFEELWVGEMATFDAFALATAIAIRTSRVPLTVGPLAVGVRDPVALAMGVASVSTIGGRRCHLALGVSTPVLVEVWHGRSWAGSLARLRETLVALRPLLAGDRAHGFRLRLEPPASTVTVAAFGEGSLRVAAESADRMVVNLVTVEQAAALKERLAAAAAGCGRPPPPLAGWVIASVDPSEETWRQLRSASVPYLGAAGYGEMFTAAGFGGLVEAARSGTHPRQLAEAVPSELLEAVGAIGTDKEVSARLDEYRAAGVDHLAVVPATAGDPGGERTLQALMPAPPSAS
ncbi:MAG: LLM class F420-dependent oxidoreductase [Acidimicrobiales bacterium]